LNTSQANQDIRNQLLVARLPAMPQILLKLLALCEADEAGMAELAKLISNDAGMTTRVLTVANSAAYHRGDGNVDLLQALNVLGMELIKTLVISEAVFQTFHGFPHASGVDLRNFWRHSLKIAVLARDVAKAMDFAQFEEAYLTGLLHDVGQLALLSSAPNDYVTLFLSNDGEGLCAREQNALHISHAEAGAWLIARWNLDSFMADTVLYHHEPAARLQGAHPLIRIVRLAHLMLEHSPQLPPEVDIASLCELDSGALQDIVLGADAQVQKAADLLGVDISQGSDTLVPALPVAPSAPADSAHRQLSDEMRNRTLLAEFSQALSRQKTDVQLLDAVRHNAQLIFNLEDTLVLLVSANSRELIGVSFGAHLQRLAEFSVPLSAGGAIAESALQRRLAFIGPEKTTRSIAEDQLLRMFDADCLVCVPLAASSRCLGLMVAGVPAWRMADLKLRERWLQTFGAQTAAALAAARDRGEMDRRIANLKEEYRLTARKLVHEVNNPLAIIKNYLGVLDEKASRQEPFGDEVSVLNEEIDRVGSILQEYVGAAPRAQDSPTDIKQLVAELLHLFKESHFVPDSVNVKLQIPGQSALVEGSADLIKQILINLIKNAIEAMPAGGQIAISGQGPVQREGRALYQLRITDNGPGIPSKVLDKLFSPVQSSKSGKNRGFGLSVVQDLVNKLGGSIQCQSGKTGTQFELLLPAGKAINTVTTASSAKGSA
jgi:HD-like signal output (HDOD) protein/nitrogen-specific signal transduction histidine kinase